MAVVSVEVARRAAVSDLAVEAVPLAAEDLEAGGLRAAASAGATVAVEVRAARSVAVDLGAVGAVPADRSERVDLRAAVSAVPASCAQPAFARRPMDALPVAPATIITMGCRFRATRSDSGAATVSAGRCRPRGTTARLSIRHSICARPSTIMVDCIRAVSIG